MTGRTRYPSVRELRFEDDSDHLCTKDRISGHMTANPDTAREASLRYPHLRVVVLSVEGSAALTIRVIETKNPAGDASLSGVTRSSRMRGRMRDSRERAVKGGELRGSWGGWAWLGRVGM